jgi:hypothetical protein
MTKFERSWQLFKASITVTLRYRKLLWFPAIATVFTSMIALFFLSAMALPVVLHHTGYHLTQKQHWIALKDYYMGTGAERQKPNKHFTAPVDPLNESAAVPKATPAPSAYPFLAPRHFFSSLVMLPVYFVSMFLATFFNVAFYSEIMAALNGQGVSFRRGLRLARSRLPSILMWSLMAGVVGWLIQAIEQRLPLLGRIVTGLIGMAWSVAAVFAIPVIIQEQPQLNPVKILQQSALTLKRTWGEGLIGYIGFSAGNLLVFVCWLIPLLLAGALAYLVKSIWLIVIMGAIWLIGLFFLAYVLSVASQVYRCALYMYAAEGVVPEPYSQDLLDMAWKVKKSN